MAAEAAGAEIAWHFAHVGTFGFDGFEIVGVGGSGEFVGVIFDIVGVGGGDFVGGFDVDAGAIEGFKHLAGVAAFFDIGFLVVADGFHVSLDGDGAAEGGFSVIHLGGNGGFDDESGKYEVCHHEKD